jgi:hypothetical protein
VVWEDGGREAPSYPIAISVTSQDLSNPLAAETVDAEIVSFDADFVRTSRGRLLPGEVPKSNNAVS